MGMIFYLQNGGGSIRRYKDAKTQSGERYDRKQKQWITDCAPQRSCEITNDKVITEKAVLELIRA